MLLDETEDVAEVFCEHHEDVLIKHVDGTFSGLQIKTRESDQKVWKTSDDAVRSSCSRFAKLEAEFPGRFRAFRFLTNHPLYAAGNGQDLRHVLQTIRAVASSVSDLSGPLARFLTRVASEAGCTAEVAFTALYKTDASDDLPKLPDIQMRLVTTLTGVWTRAADCSHASVVQAARSLASECGRASSLAHQEVLPAYLPATVDPAGTELTARLAGKRLDRSRVLELLDRGSNETAALDGDPEACVEPGTGATALLLKKLDAGGFSAVSRNWRLTSGIRPTTWASSGPRSMAAHWGFSGTDMYGHLCSAMPQEPTSPRKTRAIRLASGCSPNCVLGSNSDGRKGASCTSAATSILKGSRTR